MDHHGARGRLHAAGPPLGQAASCTALVGRDVILRTPSVRSQPTHRHKLALQLGMSHTVRASVHSVASPCATGRY